jgi:hypothetical protein
MDTMTESTTRAAEKRLPVNRDAIAPDGSDARILLGLKGGGMAHFELAPGQTSTAVPIVRLRAPRSTWRHDAPVAR